MLLKIVMGAAMVLTSVPAGNWKSDADTAKISFNVKGPFGNVDGSFTGFKSDIQFNEKNLSHSSITASIDAKTVSTGIGLRNRDLRKKAIWLDTDKYPRISYVSKKIDKADSGYKAIGELTLKGITKPVTIPFTFTTKGETGLFKGEFSIDREDYKVGKQGGSVGNKITIKLEIPVKASKGNN